jgi:dTDP-glucose pyrophosphorylase/CBS domain-containing protein
MANYESEMQNLDRFLVHPNQTLRDVMAIIDKNAEGIAMLVDGDHKLIGTVTDGDIRRAILKNKPLEAEVTILLEQRAELDATQSVTAAPDTTPSELLQLFTDHKLRHIPIVDGEGRLIDVALLSDLVKELNPPAMTAVVMAGGFGTRLHSLTTNTPKPMLPVAGKPLLELIIERLRNSGIKRVNVTTHFKKDIISDYFGDGQKFGVGIHYVEEDQPLGTAGALSLLETPDEPLLVINGDILTGVDFRAMLDFHWENEAEMTVAVHPQDFRIPYGVLDIDGTIVTGISEKPVVRHFVNAGIYLLNPVVCQYIPPNASYDMPDLIRHLLDDGLRVVSFPVHEYWRDIGNIDDYIRADKDVDQGVV